MSDEDEVVNLDEPKVPAGKDDDKPAAETEEVEPEGEDEGEEGEPKPEGEEEPEKPKRESAKARYRREAERLRAENAELLARVKPAAEVTPDSIEKIVGKPPSEDDYKGDYLAYERALTAYELDKRIAARDIQRQAVQSERAANARRMELVAEHQERIEEFRETVKDFDHVLGTAQHPVADHVSELIVESDKSAHLVYFLAKNPRELSRLNAMSERQAARAIGAIEARLENPQPAKQTHATKPSAPLKGGGSKPFNPATASVDEYARKRKAGWQG